MEEFYGEIDNYILCKRIGAGGTSKVYLGFDINNPSQPYAIKIIKSITSNDNKFFSNEITMLKQLNHPNIVKLITGGDGFLKKADGKKYVVQYLVLELVRYGELFDYIFFPQKGFGESISKYIFLQLLDALEACHKKGIVHRDMKTENIMLDNGWIMKLADFGFATKAEGKKGNGMLFTALGTASYASPELLQKKPYSGVQSDIFSIGVSLFVLVTGKMPFKHALLDDPYYKEIAKLNHERYWEKLSKKIPEVSNEFKQLFIMLIAYDPCSRPTIEETRAHKWLCDYKPNKDEINNEFMERTEIIHLKKQYEKLKEEEKILDKMKKNENYIIYRSENDSLKVEITNDHLNIREFNNKDRNPYTIRIQDFNIEKPGLVMDIIFIKLLNIKGLELIKQENKYKMTIKYTPLNGSNEYDIGDDFIIDAVESQLEIKKDSNDFIIEFIRLVGSKYDYHKLFTLIEKELKSSI